MAITDEDISKAFYPREAMQRITNDEWDAVRRVCAAMPALIGVQEENERLRAALANLVDEVAAQPLADETGELAARLDEALAALGRGPKEDGR